MNITVAVKSHNPMAHMRFDLLEQTLRSIERAFPNAYRLLCINGDTDGSEMAQRELATPLGFEVLVHDPADGNVTPGAGALFIGDEAIEIGCDPYDLHQEHVLVMSDDDMRWREGAEAKLVELWSNAPVDLMIVSGLLEPEWHWNQPRELVRCGTVPVLVRDSCPAAAWSFRLAHWPILRRFIQRRFGFDHEACKALVASSLRVAQADLAIHTGWGASTHGNDAIDAGKPLDREKWGI